MGQMTAVGKIHAEHHIAGLQHGELDRRDVYKSQTGENSTSLAMKHYLTPSTVKYLLKRMVTASVLEDKTELLDLIQKYDLHF